MGLRDPLSYGIKTIRVFLYGYDSTLQDNFNSQGIVEIARGSVAALSTPRQNAAVHLPCVSILERTGHFLVFYNAVPRPLIFLVHSLGGLILKEVWTAKSLMKLLTNFRL